MKWKAMYYQVLADVNDSRYIGYIEWHDPYLECKDCGCRNTEENFKLMAEEQCGWHQDMQPTQADKSTKRRLARRAHDTKHCMTLRDGAPQQH